MVLTEVKKAMFLIRVVAGQQVFKQTILGFSLGWVGLELVGFEVVDACAAIVNISVGVHKLNFNLNCDLIII